MYANYIEMINHYFRVKVRGLGFCYKVVIVFKLIISSQAAVENWLVAAQNIPSIIIRFPSNTLYHLIYAANHACKSKYSLYSLYGGQLNSNNMQLTESLEDQNLESLNCSLSSRISIISRQKQCLSQKWFFTCIVFDK